MYNNGMNSLLLPEFTAISALNQMSNSSVPFSMNNSIKKENDEEKKSKASNGNKPSLFQKVVGASKK